MIPLSLTIKGLYSYKKEQTINFSKLLEGQLFGVFGAVGSGKSSILEAISYALYGETERLNKNDSRSYNMMNLKSNELLIDFIFRNYEEQTYRFVVKGKRNSKQFDKVGTLERTSYKLLENGEWIPLDGANGEKIIGLSYDNFRRTIIIPQGKFQEFLQLNDKDRTNMLKEIFQLDKYEFFFQTASLERKNNDAILDLQGQLKTYEALNTEVIAQQQEKTGLLQIRFEEIHKDFTAKQALLKEQELLKKLFADFDIAKAKFEELQQKEPDFKKAEKEVKSYEYCHLNFHHLFMRENVLQNDIKDRNEKLQHLNADFDALVGILKRNELKFEELNLAHQQIDEHRQKMVEYEKILQIFSLQVDAEKLASRLNKGKQFVDKTTEDKSITEGEIIRIEKDIKQNKADSPDLQKLAEIKLWFEGLKFRKENLRRQEQDLKEKETQKLTLNDRIEVLNKSSEIVDYLSVSDLKNFLEAKTKEKESKREELQKSLNHFHFQEKMAEFSKAVTDGAPCPLCGSTHHPQILEINDVENHLEKTNTEIKVLKAEEQALQDLLKECFSLQHQEEILRNDVLKLQTENQNLNHQLLQYQSSFRWEGYDVDSEELLEKEFAKAKNNKEALQHLENVLEKSKKNLIRISQEDEKFRKVIEDFQRELNDKNSQINLLKNQLTLLVLEKQNASTIAGKLEESKVFITETLESHKALQAILEKNKADKIMLEEQLKALQSRIGEEQKELQQIADKVSQMLKESTYNHINEVKDILQQQINLDVLKQEIKRFQQLYFSAEQEFNKSQKQVENLFFEQEKYEELLAKLILVENDLKQINDELVREKQLLQNQQKDYLHKEKLLLDLQQLTLRAADITVVKNMFKANGFISYISTVYLNNLCDAANERFYKLSRQQLRLEITDKNSFEVRDYLNEGKLRSAKTLSGGQTFQASLSLALALAESVQQQTQSKQNFFFLDEGFGSLDKESLQLAFETLKSLRKEQRMVGIISHVEDLQQEIDVYLNVVNDVTEGSTVKGSWE